MSLWNKIKFWYTGLDHASHGNTAIVLGGLLYSICCFMEWDSTQDEGYPAINQWSRLWIMLWESEK